MQRFVGNFSASAGFTFFQGYLPGLHQASSQRYGALEVSSQGKRLLALFTGLLQIVLIESTSARAESVEACADLLPVSISSCSARSKLRCPRQVAAFFENISKFDFDDAGGVLIADIVENLHRLFQILSRPGKVGQTVEHFADVSQFVPNRHFVICLAIIMQRLLVVVFRLAEISLIASTMPISFSACPA